MFNYYFVLFQKLRVKYASTLELYFSAFPLLAAQDMSTESSSVCFYTLISTSTPLGNSIFISASIVFDEEL